MGKSCRRNIHWLEFDRKPEQKENVCIQRDLF